ncbi:Zn-ribbon domain-containing OB-fold protein [Nocardia sp. 348MFTsu5.1]|uniref:Zn-ribbon domain-containing OB-fold protein n=1 Tax=Nocardia sp. 348MFTsu5.1 TaxID=1172185 RepID=UPI00048AD458|nr:OB-fold domain-containing protein [Nocardia sp. 348MFTsu5.1]
MILQPVVRDAATAAFFDGAAQGILLLRRSVVTGEILSPPVEQDSVGNTDLEWIPASGLGAVVSWAFVPKPVVDSDEIASITIVIVELDEGPWWWTQLVDVEPSDIAEGFRVQALFPKSGPDESHEYVPVFGPVPDVEEMK